MIVDAVAFVVGVGLVLGSLADLVNTLVSTSTSYHRWWPSRWIGRSLFVTVRGVARRLPEASRTREALLAVFGPALLIVLLFAWCLLQVVGFGLVWWAMCDIPSIGGLGDAWYFSGVVFFTVGFGEIVPVEAVPRVGALVEAFTGVITVALVIGYLPSLYAAYSDRERALMTLARAAGNASRRRRSCSPGHPTPTRRSSTSSSCDGRSGPRASSRRIRRCRCWRCSGRTTGARTG